MTQGIALIAGYLFNCCACGNDMPLRYAAKIITPCLIQCGRCTEKMFDCVRCHADSTIHDKSPTTNLCMDCYGSELDCDDACEANNEENNDGL